MVTASVTRILTGTSSSSDLQVTTRERGEYVVSFNPESEEKEDYSLSVLHRGEHVKGSPFFLRYLNPLSLSSVHTERRCGVTDAGRPINLILALEKRGEIGVTIEGPFGPCAVSTRQEFLDQQETASIYFMPKGVGAYSIHVTLDQQEIKNSPFLVLANFSSDEAHECRIVSEDEHLFRKPLRFRGAGELTQFRVSTRDALQRSGGTGELSIVCAGPGRAVVKLRKDPEENGIEICEFSPSVDGDFQLALLWNGEHISSSPCTLQYRNAKSRITSDINLHQRVYRLGVLHRFKLNCLGLESGIPEVACAPPMAATIITTPVEHSKSTYQCEMLPLQTGTHTITIKYRGRQIAGSPFQVKFEDPCNPSACKILESSKNYAEGGSLRFKISTEGAGPGDLEGTVEDPENSISVSLTPSKLSDTLYQFEFDPGQSAVCRFSVKYAKHHIPGSPFRLVFSDPEKFKVRGDGVIAGRVGGWNAFTVRAIDPQPGVLGVKVERDHDGLKAETNIVTLSLHQFEVKYRPTSPGNYTVDARWSQIPISGSPFRVKCSSAVFQVEDAPNKVKVGSELEFTVHLVSGSLFGEEEGLEVVSKTLKGKELKGQTTLVDREQQLYACSLTPDAPGNYMVAIKWNKLPIQGSPFGVKVVAAPKAENVVVQGAGVEGGLVGEKMNFSVQTAAAGPGLLAVKIRGPSKELKFDTVQDSGNKRTVHVQYHPTICGGYSIAVSWSGVNVPGSPFKVDVLPPSALNLVEEGEHRVLVDVHPENVAVDIEQLQEEAGADSDDVTRIEDDIIRIEDDVIRIENDITSIEDGVTRIELASEEELLVSENRHSITHTDDEEEESGSLKDVCVETEPVHVDHVSVDCEEDSVPSKPDKTHFTATPTSQRRCLAIQDIFDSHTSSTMQPDTAWTTRSH